MKTRSFALLGCCGLAAACASTQDPNTVSEPLAIAEPTEVIVGELLVDTTGTANESRITCRQMLQQASNQLVRRCMSQSDWRVYDRAQEEWARHILRQMRGSW